MPPSALAGLTEIEHLHSEAEELQRQVYRLRLEKDVLEKAVEIIKKDEGVSLEKLTNREKAIVMKMSAPPWWQNHLTAHTRWLLKS